jgi:hypothetical protein
VGGNQSVSVVWETRVLLATDSGAEGSVFVSHVGIGLKKFREGGRGVHSGSVWFSKFKFPVLSGERILSP